MKRNGGGALSDEESSIRTEFGCKSTSGYPKFCFFFIFLLLGFEIGPMLTKYKDIFPHIFFTFTSSRFYKEPVYERLDLPRAKI